MPIFLRLILKALIQLAISIGIPALMKKFPGFPKELWLAIEEALKLIQNSQNPQQSIDSLRLAIKSCHDNSCNQTVQV